MSSSASTSGSKKVTLKSSDGQVFEVEEAVALASKVIKRMIEDNSANDVILLPKVTSKILSMVIEYCKKHVDDKVSVHVWVWGEMQKPDSVDSDSDNNHLDEDLKSWDAEFVKVDRPTLVDLAMAANYLNIRSLLGLTYLAMVDMIKGMTLKEVRKVFNIRGTYFSPEEEEEVTIKEKMGSKTVTLQSSDGQVFEVVEAVALKYQTIKHMIEVDCADDEAVALEYQTLKHMIEVERAVGALVVIEYCWKKLVEIQEPGDDEDSDDSDWGDWNWEKGGDWAEWYLKCWNAGFGETDSISYSLLMSAAHYRNLKRFLDWVTKTVDDMLKKLLDHMFW